MLEPPVEPLFKLAEAWRTATAASRRRAATVVIAAALVAGLLLARHGTGRARLGAAGLILLSGASVAGWMWLDRRRTRRPDGIVRRLARPVDPARADRALRALSMLPANGSAPTDGTSAELARIHVARTLAELPSARIVDGATRTAARLGAVALGAAIGVGGVVVANTWSIAEGADVLVASHGQAPVAMHWLDEIEVTARPPEYLHDDEVHEVALLPLMLPYGTQVTIRGVPAHPGRRLMLSDGTTEVPFVDDGAGAQVARWALTGSVTLRCVARFGDVVVHEPDEIALRSIPDLPPVVALEGAPRTVRLVDQVQDLTIQYDASDDHGLREVDLVLRSGVREERRVLARHDGETKDDRGGLQLRLRDAFLRKSHAPIEVTVEAKDNDPLTGPKWGKSPALTLLPPDVGEPEARRLDALRKLRDALVDTLAWRIGNPAPTMPAARKDFVASEQSRTDADDALLDSTLDGSFGGVSVPQRLRALVRTQAQRTRKVVDRELRDPSAAPHAAVVQATERYVLVVDAVIRGLGVRDSRDSARQLADVADDLALGASQLRDAGATDSRDRGRDRMDAATSVLAGGGHVMLRLGSLGRDLGEIVDADLARVGRARGGDDPTHAELAARDLAARLREPDPSFGSRGSVGRAGGESGGAGDAAGESGGSGDEVERAEQEAEQDLDRLTREHAGEIGKMEQALAEATSDDELKELRDEAKKHADAVRDAVRSLPAVGMGSDSWTSKGAAARELAEQMARSLEAVHPDEAAEVGRNALGTLDEAKKMLQRDSWIEDPNGDEQRRLDATRRKLDAEEQWAQEQVAQMRRRAAERARPSMEQGGEEEDKLADRARSLADKSRDQGSLPQKAMESIEDAERAAREAAQALKQGDADKGLDRQREAQRDLEAAQHQLQGDDDGQGSPPPRDGADDGRFPSREQVAIPDKGAGPEDFRRRVVRGLDQPSSGKLKDAVRRYAEGLLR